jgi:dTDP-4-amino-4,6-dideoxygalactose transaminase
MNDGPIIFGQPWFAREEEDLLLRTLQSGWIGQGPLVEEFEHRLASYIGADHVAAVSSCTAALELSLTVCGVGPGDEVITTPFTFVATVNAIEHSGATPVFVDIDKATLNITPENVSRRITSRTKAVIPVHFGGLPIDVAGFSELARSHDLWVIEDAAHAIGAVAQGRRIGSTHRPNVITCFSFYPNKNLASAEGGAVSIADEELAQAIRELRLHGLTGDAWRRYREPEYRPSLARAAGHKANWTDVQAAIALPQLERLEGFLATREYLAKTYDHLLMDIAEIAPTFRPKPSLDTRHALHLYQVAVHLPAPARDNVLRRLRAEQIGAAVHYIGVQRHPYYASKVDGEYPVADWASDSLLTLPLHPHMSVRDVERVAHELERAVERETKGPGRE